MSYRKERQNSAVADPEVETLGVLDKMQKTKKKNKKKTKKKFFMYSHMLVFFAGLLHAIFYVRARVQFSRRAL